MAIQGEFFRDFQVVRLYDEQSKFSLGSVSTKKKLSHFERFIDLFFWNWRQIQIQDKCGKTHIVYIDTKALKERLLLKKISVLHGRYNLSEEKIVANTHLLAEKIKQVYGSAFTNYAAQCKGKDIQFDPSVKKFDEDLIRGSLQIFAIRKEVPKRVNRPNTRHRCYTYLENEVLVSPKNNRLGRGNIIDARKTYRVWKQDNVWQAQAVCLSKPNKSALSRSRGGYRYRDFEIRQKQLKKHQSPYIEEPPITIFNANKRSPILKNREFMVSPLYKLGNWGEYQFDAKRDFIADFFDMALDGAEALKFLHSQKWIHKDIKPNNFFVVKRAGGHLGLRLGDLEMMRKYNGKSDTEISGTAFYLAPELKQALNARLQGDSSKEFHTTYATDLYSYGKSLNEKFQDIFKLIQQDRSISKEKKTFVYSKIQIILESLLDKDPEKRANSTELSTYLKTIIAQLQDFDR